MVIKILRAGNGDSLLIRFLGNDNKFKNILVDGGNKKSEYESCLKSEIIELIKNGENIDLLVITHTDQDHVKGIEYLLKDTDIDKTKIKEVWFNSFDNSISNNNLDISYRESCRIQNLLKDYSIERYNNITIDNVNEIDFFGSKITLLSPTKNDLDELVFKNSYDISSYNVDYSYSIDELISKNTKIFNEGIEDLDSTIENRVSIAFLLESKSKSILLLGDANPDIIENSLIKLIEKRKKKYLQVDILKLSHHASCRSLSLSLLNLIDTNCYIISTNGSKANLPNKLTFAKILNRANKTERRDHFLFNYDRVIESLKFKEEDQIKYNFNCLNPNYERGYIIKL